MALDRSKDFDLSVQGVEVRAVMHLAARLAECEHRAVRAFVFCGVGSECRNGLDDVFDALDLDGASDAGNVVGGGLCCVVHGSNLRSNGVEVKS